MSRELPKELARHLEHLLKRCRQRYRQRLERCQKHFSEKAVHELRVETRRALALLDLVGTLEISEACSKPRRALKRRLDAFDALRDTHVEMGLLQPWLKQFPEAQAFADFLTAGEKKLVAELRGEINHLKARRLERMIKALGAEVKAARSERPGSGAEALHVPLRAAFARVAELRRQVRRLDTSTIHRTRVAFKKFRYLCELFQPLIPDLTARQLRAMHDWQTRMGQIQDVEVLLNDIERAVRREHVPVAAVQRLHAALAQRLVSLVNRFMTTAHRLEQFRPPAPGRKAARPNE